MAPQRYSHPIPQTLGVLPGQREVSLKLELRVCTENWIGFMFGSLSKGLESAGISVL